VRWVDQSLDEIYSMCVYVCVCACVCVRLRNRLCDFIIPNNKILNLQCVGTRRQTEKQRKTYNQTRKQCVYVLIEVRVFPKETDMC
jgi:hypothetical protein